MKFFITLISFLFLAPAGAQEEVPEWPLELVKIEKVNYPRNRRASFCVRPPEMVDTVVFHHSMTPVTDTAMRMNELHLNRGTPQDPWYMVAYTYVINSPYEGGSQPRPLVTEGRPFDIVGAHAGSQAFVPMEDFQQKIWDDNRILCGRENEPFRVDPGQLRNGRIKANVTTIGVVVVGNYAPFARDNPQGWPAGRPRNPSAQTQDIAARLSCQLQKKYPNIKKIRWHNYYNATTCPGTIERYIGQIRELAKGYGCDFN